MFTFLTEKSTPMVALYSYTNLFCTRRWIIVVFPTSAFPTTRTLYWYIQLDGVALDTPVTQCKFNLTPCNMNLSK